jgi:SAM-dependent methyltransferase
MARVTGDTHLQSQVLEDLTDAVNYLHWLADLARPFLGDDPLEVGSGIGSYAEAWLATTPRFTVTEGDETRLAVLRERFAGDKRVSVRRLLLPTSERAEHSAVVALNVLEHIPDDVAALHGVSRLVRPGGAVVVLVPAFESAMSRFDRAIGHERRYTVRTLRAAYEAAGLTVELVRYVNPVGLLSWYVLMRLLRLTPRNGALLRGYDRVVVPALRALDRRWVPPFGQSVFAVGRVPGGPA